MTLSNHFRALGALTVVVSSLVTVSAHATATIANYNSATTSARIGLAGISGVSTVGSSAYDFIFTPGTYQTPGALNTPNANFTLATTVNNGCNSCQNIFALDGNPGLGGELDIQVTGLTVGVSQSFSFYYAGSEEQGFTSNFAGSEGLDVTLADGPGALPVFGASGQTINGISYLTSQGTTANFFSTMVSFTPDASTEYLEFIANGPNGLPPIVLIGGITAGQLPPPVVPEPNSLLLLSTGLLGLSGYVRSRMPKKS